MNAPTSPVKLAQNAGLPKGGQSLDSYDPDRWAAEPKLDGHRLLIHRTESGVEAWTRSAKSNSGKLPGIEAEVAANLPPGTWLDGEAVALRIEHGKVVHDWSSVQKVLGSGVAKAAAKSESIQFMAFDLLAHGGIDARSLPYERRRKLLEQLFENCDFSHVLLVPQVKVSDESLEALLSQGFEGMILKDRKARYASGQRGHGWIKVKPQDTLDAVVTGFKPGQNGFTGLVGAVEFSQFQDGELVERGRCSGMTMQTRQSMTTQPEKWLGAVIEVKHMGVMESGKLRHPQMHRLRQDKAPEECVW